ncbi:GTPase Era [Hydrogenimonas thermophila]|uniref:GTPase Era n=1 Tax=Hydrogenimonas thermophila TaxID=223786 RepID=UPI00293701DC|nr:GTPase Era [Hydrogenimonas thermophila]WOE68934.1 GTPase Era [Hydrogenimonas thermophila]WOE71441.1 GTPase Era [Hydrogenimonas thermophila]
MLHDTSSNVATKAGFVAVVGRPNAGKSTMLNWLVGEKLAMVSKKAQATRKRMNIIVMHENAQIIFVDTPGIHEKERLLNQFMLSEAIKAIGDCDLVLFLAPAKDKLDHYKKFLELNSKNRPHIVVLTKIDEVSQEALLAKIAEYQAFQNKFLALIPVSVTKGVGKDQLLDEITKHLPHSPWLYDPELLTTTNIREIYKEMIRESIFDNLSDEIPYETDVIIEKIDELPHLDRVQATIITEKKSQKMIIVGKGGSTIKRIGRDARMKMEQFSQKKIYLELFVSVKSGWSKNKKSLSEIGYNFD